METGAVLLTLFVAFTAAKLFGEVFERLRLPSVVGELLAGVVVGPSVLGWVAIEGHEGELLHLLAELGVIILLFAVGLETAPSELRAVGPQATAVGFLGVVLPFAGGYATAALMGQGGTEAAFVAAALTATSVGITARVLTDLGRLGTPPARVVIGAAVIDDILGLIILAVVVGLAAGSLSAVGIAVLGAEALLFVAVAMLVGPRVLSRVGHLLEAPKTPRAPFVIAIAVLLGLSVLAEQIGLAALVGAFLAGTIFSGTRDSYALENRVEPVADLLTPFFFVATGAQLDLTVLGDASVLGFAAAITVVAVIGKLIAGVVGARALGPANALAVGIGMIPRGEVGIVVASLALRAGVVDRDVFGAVLIMVAVTTVLAPPFLQRQLRRADVVASDQAR